MKARLQPIPKRFFWWTAGFLSALAVMFLVTLWMASAVYSELPKRARLDADFEPVDVIVCLTGGKGRIRLALELYEKGRGRLLYISGIDPQVQMKGILREIKFVGPIDERNLILENVATNTIENAKQVEKFMRDRRLKSALLVTSVYHVRRASYIFRKILPKDAHIEVTWLEHEPFDEQGWWKTWNGISVTVSEFLKFFYAYLKIPG
ncbi:MAG: YdcF family protein [Deltaproteobacteria bacterium]|nr:YdcF family protein [Deltaproteobacteria bacterium]